MHRWLCTQYGTSAMHQWACMHARTCDHAFVHTWYPQLHPPLSRLNSMRYICALRIQRWRTLAPLTEVLASVNFMVTNAMAVKKRRVYRSANPRGIIFTGVHVKACNVRKSSHNCGTWQGRWGPSRPSEPRSRHGGQIRSTENSGGAYLIRGNCLCTL